MERRDAAKTPREWNAHLKLARLWRRRPPKVPRGERNERRGREGLSDAVCPPFVGTVGGNARDAGRVRRRRKRMPTCAVLPTPESSLPPAGLVEGKTRPDQPPPGGPTTPRVQPDVSGRLPRVHESSWHPAPSIKRHGSTRCHHRRGHDCPIRS